MESVKYVHYRINFNPPSKEEKIYTKVNYLLLEKWKMECELCPLLYRLLVAKKGKTIYTKVILDVFPLS